MTHTQLPMATGKLTPIRLQVRPSRSDRRDVEISISAGVTSTRTRVTMWSMECHPSWWWEFGPQIVEEAILMSVQGVVPVEWPRRLDAVVKNVYTQLALPLREHHPGE